MDLLSSITRSFLAQRLMLMDSERVQRNQQPNP